MRFLALVSNGERLSELSEKAANSQDAATLQVLKTMDSIEAKTQQLQTSLQSLYTSTGIQNLFKGLLDFGNDIINTFTKMPTVFNLPLVAIAKFGTQFYTLANVVTTVFGLIKSRLTMQSKILQGQMTNDAKTGEMTRVQISQEEMSELQAILEQGPEARAKLEERMTQIAQKGANDRTNIAKGEAAGISRAQVKGGLIASAAGSTLSLLSSTMGENTQAQRNAKGLTDLAGSVLSGVGTGLMIGGPAGAAVGALTVLPGLITSISTMIETAAEKQERLKKAVEETNNAYLQKKDTAKTLEEQIEKLEELEKTQNDSAEAREKFIEASNQIAQTNPELISGYDLEGNALIDLTSSYYALKQAREAANEAAKETAKASIDQADNNIKTAEENERKIFDEYKNRITGNYGNSKLDELFSFAKDNDITISKESQELVRTQIGENLNWVINYLENTYFDLVSAYQEAGTSLQDVLIDIANSNEEIKNNDTISSITEDIEAISFEEQVVMEDIESLLLTGDYKEVTKSINANREYLNNIRDKLVDAEGEDFWAVKYLESWLELNGEATGAMADVEKATQMRASLIKSKISSISGSILNGEQNDFGNEYLKEMENINSFVAQALSQRQKELENPEEGQEAIDPQKFIDEYLENELKDVQDFLQKFWTTYLDTKGKRNDFNQLMQNAKQYSPEQIRDELLKLAPQLAENEEELNTFIASIYGEDLENYINNFKASVEQRLANNKNNNKLNEKLESFNLEGLGQIDTSAILDKYDQLQEMVAGGAITDNYAASLLEQYKKLLDASKEIKDSGQREQVQSALQELDLTSLESVETFIKTVTEIGFLVGEEGEKTAKALRESVPVNLNTEVNTYVEKISSEMEDFESALSKATSGMKYKDAAAIAAKMDVSVEDFRQVGDKFFIDDLDALEKAYFDTSNDLVEGLRGKIQKLSDGLGNLKEGILSDEKVQADDFDAASEDFKEELSSTLQEAGVSVNLESLNLENIRNQWLKIDENIRGSFVDYLIQQLTSSLEEAEKVQKVINTQKAEGYLAQGNFTNFLENLDLDEGQYSRALDAFNDGRLDEVFEIIPQYADKITETFKKINQDIYNRIISETSNDNWVLRTEANEDLLQKLNTAGLIDEGKYDEESGQFYFKLSEITENNIQAYYDTITNDATLTASEKATERAKATTALWNKSLDRYLQEVFKNTESVSQEVAEQLRTLLGLSDEDFNTIFEQNGNNYIVNASELTRVANESGQEISDATQNMGNEAIQKTTDSIIKEISTATDLLSKGSTSAADIEKFVSDFNKVTGQNLTADQMFSFDETLDTSVLNSKYYQQYVAAKKAEMLQYGATEEQVNNYVDKLTEKSLAAAVDIDSFVKAENREVGSQAYNKLADQMRDYYSTIYTSEEEVNERVQEEIEAISKGGRDAAAWIQVWAQRRGQKASSSDIETAYRASISQLEEAFDQLSYGVGSIVSGEATKILKGLEDKGYKLHSIGGGSAIIESVGNVTDAYLAYYEKLKANDAATVAALNEAYAKVLETSEGSDVISALGDAASMTYTKLGEILASKGLKLEEQILDGIVESIGGGKVRITNFDRFATEIMQWTDIDKNSEEYVSAFKTYNDSLISMNRKAERNILEEVSKLNGAGAGDWVNLTQLYSKLQEAIVPDWYNGNVNLEKRPRVSAEDLIDKGWYAEIGEKGTINGTTFSWDEIVGMPEKMMVSLASITEDGLVKSYGEVKGYLQGLVNSASMQGQVDINKLKQLDEENQNLLLDIFISESNDINEAILEAEERAGDLHDRQALFEDFLNEELLEYGAQLENGVLQISDEGANIPMIMKTLADKVQEYGNLSVQEEAELLDTLNANLKSYSDAISNAIKGTATNVEIQKISDWANNLGIQIDFTKTVDGLKLSQESAIKLYNELKKVDYLQSQLVFKELSDSLKKNNANYKDMSSILARIKTLEEEISNIPESDARRKKYEEELALAKEIKETRSLTDPDSFNFMGNDIPDAMKGAENYWNSWGNAFKAMNEAGESGYMGITDFYNIVNEMNNLAKMSGNTLTFMGRELNGNAKDAADLIQEGMGYLANVDGGGVSVALKNFGSKFASGAASMQTGVKGGIKAMAESQIEMLDAMIGLLEVIVAFEGFKEIDTDGIFGLDFSEMFESAGETNEDGETLFRSTQKVKDIADKILKMSDTNEDLKKALDEVKINGTSAREALKELNSDNLKTKDEWEKYRKITDILYKAAASGDYSTQNLTQLIKEAFGDSDEVTEVEIYGRKFAIKGDVIIEQDKNGNYIVDGQKYRDAKQAIEAQTFKQTNNLEEVVRNENGTYSGSFLVDKKYNVTVTSTLNEDGTQGEPTYSINGEGSYTREQALEKLYEESGYDSKQDWILNSNVVAQFNMTISEIKATLGEDTNLGDLTDDLLSQLGIDVSLVNAVEAGIERAFSENGGGVGDALASSIATALNNWTPTDDQVKNFNIPNVNAKVDKVSIVDTGTVSFGQNLTGIDLLDNAVQFGSNALGLNTLTIPEATAKVETLTLSKPTTTNFTAVEEGQSNAAIDNLTADVTKLTLNAPTETDAQAAIDAATTAGQDINAGLVEGMSDTTAITEKAAEVGTAAVNAINTAAGTHSPSTITTQTGKDLVAGLIAGLSDEAARTNAVSQATSLAQQIIDAIQSYFNQNPLSLSANLNTPETLAPKNSPAQVSTPSVDISGITALQNAISTISTAGISAAAEIQKLSTNLLDSTTKATDFETALSNIGDNGKTKAEDFETALSAIGDNGKNKADEFETALSNIKDNGKNKADEFQDALSKIGDNGKKKADDFAAALDSIKQDGINYTNSFKNSVNDIEPSGASIAHAFKEALNGIYSSGPSYAEHFKSAVNNMSSSAASYAANFVNAANRLDSNGIKVNLDIDVNVKGSGGAQSTGTHWQGNYSYAKGNQGLAYSGGKDTLMGELGPELVVSHGRYFLVGQNGPEMVKLDDDAIVFNHLQTKKLIEKGKINSHGTPVTNERKATSMATGNVEGPALASASEVLAMLKQLREMWRSLRDATIKDLGVNAGKAGKTKDKGSGKTSADKETKDTEKYTAGIESNVERWYNWLQAIEATQNKINKLTKEYNILEKERVSTQEKLENLQQQYKLRQENKDTEERLAKEQAEYRNDVIDKANQGLMSAFYQADKETGQVYLANDDAFQKYVNEQRRKGLAVGELSNVMAQNGAIYKGKTIKRGLSAEERKAKAEDVVQSSYGRQYRVPDYLKQYYKNGELIEGKEEEAKKAAEEEFKSSKYTKSVQITRTIKTGLDFMEELQAQDDAGNLVHDAADQLALIKQMGLFTEDLMTGIDTATEGWEAQVVQRFYDKVEEDKESIESLTDSIREQELAALDDAAAMEEINEKIRSITKVASGVTDGLEKWYNETKKIQASQQEINKLVKEMELLQKDQKINGDQIYQSLKNQENSIKNQIKLNNDLIAKRKKEAQELKSRYKDLPIVVDQNGLATFSEKAIGAKNGVRSVTTSYTKVKTNVQGYEVDVNGNYRDKEGNLRDKTGKIIEGNFGELAVENVTGHKNYNFANKNIIELLNDLTSQDIYGETNFKAQEQYQILKAAGLEKYMQYDEKGNKIYDDFGTLTQEEMEKAVSAAIKRIQNSVNEINTNNDEIVNLDEEQLKLQSDLLSIQQQLIDNQIEVEKMVKDAIEQLHQDAIDAKKELKDALDEASSRTIEGLQNSLDAEKSMYEKTENENQLAVLQRQLEVAQRSGASMSKIQNLQEQVASAQKDMYFTNREQLIDNIENSMQRELEALDTQISIMEATFEYQKENGLLWAEINEVLKNTPAAIIDFISQHTPALISASETDRLNQLNTIGDKITEFKAYQENKDKKEQEAKIEIETESKNTPEQTTPKNEEKEVKAQATIKEDNSEIQVIDTEDDFILPEVKQGEIIDDPSWLALNLDESLKTPDGLVWEETWNANKNKKYDPNKKVYGVKNIIDKAKKIAREDPGISENDIIKALQQKYADQIVNKKDSPAYIAKIWNGWSDSTLRSVLRTELKKNGKVPKFKEGGDIDFSGLAWVDGTKKEPEHIFNFQQMEALRAHLLNGVDVTRQAIFGLSDTLNQIPNINTYNSINNTTDSGISIGTLEFHMEVAEIANDYDARRAGEQAMNEIVRIARKSGTRSLSRR